MVISNFITPPQGALKIFLSSTIGDYKDFRRQVKDVLLNKAECACFLSEDWVVGYDATVTKCQQQVKDSGGFILMLGHWYGSIPPGEEKSITHLEFEWAFENWKNHSSPRMAVLKPLPGSAIDRKLIELARPLIPTVPSEEVAKHASLLRKFHDQVDDKHTEWHIIRTFKSERDLREYAIVIGRDWRGYTPMAAAQGRIEVEWDLVNSHLRDDKLGQIGRNPHYDAIEAILSNVVVYPQVPAMAIVVYGDGDVGQRVFLSNVVATLLKDYYPKRPIGRLPVEGNSIPALVGWLARTLSIAGVGCVETPEQLAEQVAEELMHQPLYFTLDCIGDLAGGILVFREQFWLPFWKRLETLRLERKITHRIVALLTDYTGDITSWGDAVSAPDADESIVDYTKLLLIPRLGLFKRADLLAWFGRMKVPDNGAGRLVKLSERILKNEQGEFDPHPPHVFDRLRRETLWPEGGM
ncbi:MAG: DUF4062 domain-containing protein [Methylococcaceae bacterium]|jgi:hypothetical protein